MEPMRILLSAYACEPGRGSEPGVGWNWAIQLAMAGHQVWVLTRKNNQRPIEIGFSDLDEQTRKRLNFIYFDPPRWMTWWKKGGRGVQLYYSIWQRMALDVARSAHAKHQFQLAHHITFGVWRQPSLLYKLGIPFIFGPVGGGEAAPKSLIGTLPITDQLKEHIRHAVNRLSLLNPTLRACVKSAQMVVAKTPETVEWLRRAGAMNPVQQLEIGIEPPPARNQEKPRSFDGNLRCIFAGRLLGWKGSHLAIEAIAHAHAAGAKISLTIVGKGPLEPKLRQRVAQLGISKIVTFAGWLSQNDLFAQYDNHDVLLFPSLHDSSGNVVLEAMAHGLPVICLNCGGPAMMIDNSNGISIKVNNQKAHQILFELGNSLAKIASSEELLNSLHNGAIKTSKMSDWKNTCDSIYKLFAQNSAL